MAWQRTIPFGYRMENGEIVPHPEEAEAVSFIYDSYLQGESYRHIAAAMGKLGMRYHTATPEWNKHMVKRMLENPKYAGQEPYPAIISPKAWSDAQDIRQRKTQNWKEQPPCVEMVKRQIVCGKCGSPFNKNTPTNASGNRWWHCENPECACTLKMRDEALEEAVTALLNRLIIQPELLDPAEGPQPLLSLEAVRIQNEINRELGKTEPGEDYLTALIFNCAAEKYSALESSTPRRENARLKTELKNRPLLTAFDPALFSKATEALLVGADKTLSLRLRGGRIISAIGKENTTYADNH